MKFICWNQKYFFKKSQITFLEIRNFVCRNPKLCLQFLCYFIDKLNLLCSFFLLDFTFILNFSPFLIAIIFVMIILHRLKRYQQFVGLFLMYWKLVFTHIDHEWVKWMKFLLVVIYVSPWRHSNSSKKYWKKLN